MFENLSERLSKAARSLSGKGRLTEDNIQEALRRVETFLAEARASV